MAKMRQSTQDDYHDEDKGRKRQWIGFMKHNDTE